MSTAGWTLRIHGLVDRETMLTWEQLIALPMIEQYVTIACVSNEVGGKLVGNAKWTGVRLRDVLDIAGVQASATQLVGRSVDGWTAGMPTAWVMDPAREPMIAFKMNDEPLPRIHGYPARLIVPGLFGYVSATKWLKELELTTLESFNGYWVPLGWAKEGPILTQSRIDTPRGGVAAGQVAIAGIAWAPDRGISKVEVAIDGVVARRPAVGTDLERHLGPVGRPTGRPMPATTRSRFGRQTAPARSRTSSRRPPLPTEPAAGTPSTSTSADGAQTPPEPLLGLLGVRRRRLVQDAVIGAHDLGEGWRLRHQLLAVGDRLVDRQLSNGVVVAAEQIQRAKLDQPLEELSPLVLRHLVP